MCFNMLFRSRRVFVSVPHLQHLLKVHLLHLGSPASVVEKSLLFLLRDQKDPDPLSLIPFSPDKTLAKTSFFWTPEWLRGGPDFVSICFVCVCLKVSVVKRVRVLPFSQLLKIMTCQTALDPLLTHKPKVTWRSSSRKPPSQFLADLKKLKISVKISGWVAEKLVWETISPPFIIFLFIQTWITFIFLLVEAQNERHF